MVQLLGLSDNSMQLQSQETCKYSSRGGFLPKIKVHRACSAGPGPCPPGVHRTPSRPCVMSSWCRMRSLVRASLSHSHGSRTSCVSLQGGLACSLQAFLHYAHLVLYWTQKLQGNCSHRIRFKNSFCANCSSSLLKWYGNFKSTNK